MGVRSRCTADPSFGANRTLARPQNGAGTYRPSRYWHGSCPDRRCDIIRFCVTVENLTLIFPTHRPLLHIDSNIQPVFIDVPKPRLSIRLSNRSCLLFTRCPFHQLLTREVIRGERLAHQSGTGFAPPQTVHQIHPPVKPTHCSAGHGRQPARGIDYHLRQCCIADRLLPADFVLGLARPEQRDIHGDVQTCSVITSGS